MRERLSRRRVVVAATGGLAATAAGCLGDGDGTATVEPTDGGDGPQTADAAGTAEPDLREANVVDVAVERDGADYTFDVTLHHDDDGEDGYANWWQVERLDGQRLGRRELRHPHSQQPFTRSATVGVPDDVDCVVVRGHDETHEYGGRLAVVDLGSGATTVVDQGAERRPVAPDECPTG